MGEDYPIPEYPPIIGEIPQTSSYHIPSIEKIVEKKLSFYEASCGLSNLGKDETGCRYAYLTLTAMDMKLTDVSVILNFKHVMFLDLSGNFLTIDALQVLTKMPYLLLLKAERNRVAATNLATMYYLQVLDFNYNQIKTIGEINQPLLDCLELNYNNIYTTNFDNAELANLKHLELRSNLLFDISGSYPTNLEKLYLAANKIASINSLDFSKLTHLEILHLRDNSLQQLDGFSDSMRSLKYLNLRNNKISKFREFQKLQCLPNLATLVVLGNPLPGANNLQDQAGEGATGEGGQIRDAVVIPILVLLPNLKRINKTVIKAEDRFDAEDVQEEMIKKILGEDDEILQNTARESLTSDATDFE